jgi:hypothetical protein
MRIYIVWMVNKTDRRDDTWLKVRARNRAHARYVAHRYGRSNFTVGVAETLAEAKRSDPEVHSLEWGKPCVNDKEEK